MPEATLLVIQGKDQGSRFDIGAEDVQIGRGTQNQIRILNKEISRAHAGISYAGGEWQIEDLNSSNGTYVNGREIDARIVLHPGDQVQLGRTVLLFSKKTPASPLMSQINVVPQRDEEDSVKIVGGGCHGGGQRPRRMGASRGQLAVIVSDHRGIGPSVVVD